jgi:hypothetical protein
MAEKLLKAILLIAFTCYAISWILRDFWSALSSTIFVLAIGIILVDIEHKKKFRELEKRVKNLEQNIGR